MKDIGKFVKRFGMGIKGFGGVMFTVVLILAVISIVHQCQGGATVQLP